jgi:hypothetical protein
MRCVQRWNVVVLVFLSTFFLGRGGHAEVVPDSDSITAIFEGVEGEIIGFNEQHNELVFYKLLGNSLKQHATVSVQGAVSQVVVDKDGYLVASGAGKKDRQAPIRIYRIPKAREGATLIYKKQTPRTQVVGLKTCGDKIWLDFFNSKYFTSIGYLKPIDNGQFDFFETLSIRMGSSFDCFGERIIIGRSYGDIQGADGDLILVENGKQTLLPSYRGVRGLRVLSDDSIIIGDGWHSNYGKIAQGRVSLLSRHKTDERFHLEILANSTSNYNFTKFIPIPAQSSSYVLALGSKDVGLVSLTEKAAFKSVYKQKNSNTLMDAAVVKVSGGVVTLAILDGQLSVQEIVMPNR